MKKEVLKHKNIQYVFSAPEDFDENKKYPTIFFLHGAGTRGTDIKPLINNPYFKQTEAFKLDIVTFAPQCYKDSWFDIFEQLQDFIEFALENKFVDKEKVYVVGASMGGYATWQIAMTMPDKFAAIVPVCGGGMYGNAARLKNVKVWAFHGSEDDIVYVNESINMVDSVNKNGGEAKLTICEGVGHASWINAYTNPELFEWLLSQSKTREENFENKFNNEELFG